MGDTTAWEWPCDNYRAPHTCLTAPCAKGAECDFCRAQAEPVRRAALEDAEAAVLRVEREGVGLNEQAKAGVHIAAAAIRARILGLDTRIARTAADPTGGAQ